MACRYKEESYDIQHVLPEYFSRRQKRLRFEQPLFLYQCQRGSQGDTQPATCLFYKHIERNTERNTERNS
jgi:hypothetical protein